MVNKKFISFINIKLLKFNYGSVIKKKNQIKIKKKSSIFLYNRFFKIPLKFFKLRISCYNGKSFFSFLIKKKFIGSFFSNFIKTKKIGPLIHISKKKKNIKKK